MIELFSSSQVIKPLFPSFVLAHSNFVDMSYFLYFSMFVLGNFCQKLTTEVLTVFVVCLSLSVIGLCLILGYSNAIDMRIF